MRNVGRLAIGLVIVGTEFTHAGLSFADEPSAAARFAKGQSKPVSIQLPPHILMGGEDFGTATSIPSLPFDDGGNTCGSLDDYSPACAYAGNSAAPDVVYVFQPTTDVCVDISLCGSGFDTVLHVYENDPATLIACNDDRCGLQSQLTDVTLFAGNDYYIVVDGWASECGDYLLNVAAVNPTLTGAVQYYAPPLPNTNPVSDVQVCVDPPDTCGSSDPTGAYKVRGAVPGPTLLAASKTPTPADPGAIGGGDVVALIWALAFSTTLTPDQEFAADVDGSGTVNDVDWQLLRRWLVFDMLACPRCASWIFFCDPLGVNSPSPCAVTIPACTNPNVDLKGILVGDIDGSWPNRFKASAGAPVGFSLGTARWTGSEFSLPLLADTHGLPLSSLMFSLDYDSNAAEYVGTDVTLRAAGFDLTLNPDTPGVLHGLLTGPTGQRPTSGEILDLRFRMRDGSTRASVSFSRLVANDRDAERIPSILVSRDGQTEALPQRFQLSASPNPFNPTTRIEYTIPAGAGPVSVSLRVLDLSGRLVRDLVQTRQGPGRYRAAWDGTSPRGEFLASGVYLLQLRAGSMTSTQKAVLLK